MRKGRRPSGLEELSEHPGFLATPEQREWLESARIAAGEGSLSDWLRSLAADAGEKSLGKPFPRRKLVDPKQRKKR